MRRRALLELREATKRERQLARSQCSADLAAAREIAGKVARARAELLAERTYRRDLKRIEQGNRARSLEMKRATRAERGGESDDEVRQNLSPEYLNLWERVKSKIRGSARMTRSAPAQAVDQCAGRRWLVRPVSADHWHNCLRR